MTSLRSTFSWEYLNGRRCAARQDTERPVIGDDTGVVADADVTKEDEPSGAAGEASKVAEPQATPAAKASWSMPKAPVSRDQVDEFGRNAAKAVGGVVKALAAVARHGARAAAVMWRAIGDVPVALRALFVLAFLMLLGIVGSIALSGTAGLLCAIVVVPVSSIAVGALGHRWLAKGGAEHRAVRAREAEPSELARSIVYVDKKLTVALNSFGSERHQQAVVALFQAKTAVELALGTEGETASHINEAVPIDVYGMRPRIQAGAASKSLTSEPTSAAAS